MFTSYNKKRKHTMASIKINVKLDYQHFDVQVGNTKAGIWDVKKWKVLGNEKRKNDFVKARGLPQLQNSSLRHLTAEQSAEVGCKFNEWMAFLVRNVFAKP